MGKSKDKVIEIVKLDLASLIDECNYLLQVAKSALEVFDDFNSEKTLNKLDLMLDIIRQLNNIVLNLLTTTKMACLVVRRENENQKEKENADDKRTKTS